MRNFILSMLLASAAASTPALAQDHDDGRWHRNQQQSNGQQVREERQQVREQRQQVRDQARAEGFEGAVANDRAVQAQQQAQRQFEFRQQMQSEGSDARHVPIVRSPQQVQIERGNVEHVPIVRSPQQVEAQRWGDRRGGGFSGGQVDVQQPTRDAGGWTRDRSGNWTRTNGATGGWTRDRTGGWTRNGDQGRVSGSQWAGSNWNREWRNDPRYDWRRYRYHHRSVFRLGIYIDPFGYGYRPFGIGYQMYPGYYSQRYWIDPSLYQLPYPPPGTVWVRYYNDALLVDIYSGEVVDVIHDFFW